MSQIAAHSDKLAYNLGTNGVIGKVNKVGRKYAYTLKSGGRVDANRDFLTGSTPDIMWGVWESSGRLGSEGNWKSVTNGYVGVKFAINGSSLRLGANQHHKTLPAECGDYWVRLRDRG